MLPRFDEEDPIAARADAAAATGPSTAPLYLLPPPDQREFAPEAASEMARGNCGAPNAEAPLRTAGVGARAET